MEKEFKKSMFYRALMTAVFAGIFTTLLTLLYDLLFVKYFDFPLSEIINVATLIFFVNLVFFVVGFIYYWFIRFLKKGDLLFVILFILLTVFFVWKAEAIDRTDNAVLNIEFRGLLSGIIIIMGIFAAIVVPLLYHSKKFEDYVL